MGVHGDWTVGCVYEGYFRWLYTIARLLVRFWVGFLVGGCGVRQMGRQGIEREEGLTDGIGRTEFKF